MGKFSKNKMIYSWLRSYLLVSVVMIIVFIPLFSIANNQIVKQNNEINSYILSETKQLFDSYIYEAKNCVYAAYSSDFISKVVYTDENEGLNQYNAYTYKDDITNLLVGSPSVSNLIIYLPQKDALLTKEGFFTALEYFSIYYEKDDTLCSNWLEFIKGSREYCIFSYGNNAKLIFKIGSSKSVGSMSDCIIIAEINSDVFTAKIKDVYDKTGYDIVVKDTFSNMMLGYTVEPEEKYVTIEQKSDNLESLVYMLKITDSRYYEAVNYMKGVIFLSIVIGFIIICIVGAYFSHKNYIPVKKLLKFINLPAKNKNEFELLGNYINKLTVQNTNMEKRHVLSNILNEIYSEEDEALFTEYYSNFSGKNYVTVLIVPDDEGIEKLKENKYTKNEIRVIFVNIIQELLEEKYPACVTEINGMYCAIINTFDDYNENELAEILKNARKLIFEHFGVYFKAVVGSLEEYIPGIGKSYSKCAEIARLLKKNITGEIIFHHKFEMNSVNTGRVKAKITEEVKAGNHLNAFECFKKFLDESVKSYVKMEMIILRTVEIMNSVANKVLPTGDIALVEQFDCVDRFWGCDGAESLEKSVDMFLKELCSIKPNDETGKKEIEICKFIQENYMDSNLSISLIGDEFSLHPVYLSRMFKEKMGYTLLEYITEIRMKKAKEMLLSNSESIKEIAKQTGYTSVQSFSRAFKNAEGVSPGAFRENK